MKTSSLLKLARGRINKEKLFILLLVHSFLLFTSLYFALGAYYGIIRSGVFLNVTKFIFSLATPVTIFVIWSCACTIMEGEKCGKTDFVLLAIIYVLSIVAAFVMVYSVIT